MTSPHGVHAVGAWIFYVTNCRVAEAPKLGATTTASEASETEKGNRAWCWQREETFAELDWSTSDAAVVSNLHEEGAAGGVADAEDHRCEENLTRNADAALKVRWVRVEPTCDASGGAVWDACLIETQSSPTWVTIGRVAGSKARTATDADVRVKCAWGEDELWVPGTSSGRRNATGERVIVDEASE